MTSPHPSTVGSETLQRISTVEALKTAVRHRVLGGAEPPGSQLREVDLCARFGVSRHSLRTALQALIHEGLLTHEANRGIFVVTVDAAGVRDIYRLRELVEVEAASVLSGDANLLPPLEAALDVLAGLPAGTAWDVVRDADLGFHRALVTAMGRPRTSEVFSSLASELQLVFRQMRSELEDTAEVVRQHAEIYRAIEAGERSLATRLVRSHLHDAERQICASLQSAAA